MGLNNKMVKKIKVFTSLGFSTVGCRLAFTAPVQHQSSLPVHEIPWVAVVDIQTDIRHSAFSRNKSEDPEIQKFG
jgi:hypothetical protein